MHQLNNTKKIKNLQKMAIFSDLLPAEKVLKDEMEKTAEKSESMSENDKTIKIMDIILLNRHLQKKHGVFQPLKWVYTNLDGQILAKDIHASQINEVIKSFLINI